VIIKYPTSAQTRRYTLPCEILMSENGLNLVISELYHIISLHKNEFYEYF